MYSPNSSKFPDPILKSRTTTDKQFFSQIKSRSEGPPKSIKVLRQATLKRAFAKGNYNYIQRFFFCARCVQTVRVLLNFNIICKIAVLFGQTFDLYEV
jgi:hypothetical protein